MATTYDSRGNPLPTAPTNPFLIQTPNRDGTFNTTDLRTGLPEGYKVAYNPTAREPGTSIQYTSPSGYTAGDIATAQYKESMFGFVEDPAAKRLRLANEAIANQPRPVGPRSFLARSRGSLVASLPDQAAYSASRKKNPFLIPFTPNADQFGLNIPT